MNRKSRKRIESSKDGYDLAREINDFWYKEIKHTLNKWGTISMGMLMLGFILGIGFGFAI